MEATLSVQQVICPHCEELVHRNVSSCPYCRYAFGDIQDGDAASQHAITSDELVAHLRPVLPIQKQTKNSTPQKKEVDTARASTTFKTVSSTPSEPLLKLVEALQKNENKEQDLKQVSKLETQLEDAASEHSESIGKVLFALFSLLAGSFFVVFGLILKLFSKNGKFVLEWSQDAWPYYLFPALFLLVYGMLSFTSGDPEIQ
jgi:hypothetical protein